MCGIVGYVGNEQAAPILLNGLAKLEYRGYDSAGIAVRDGDKHVEVVKAKGRLKALEEKTVKKYWCCLFITYISNYSTHRYIPLF